MEYQEEEEYILLNFKERVEQKFFDRPNLFFKVANLDTKRPLFQIGNHVFVAKVDQESLGTSLIFEEHEPPTTTNVYEDETHIHLKFKAKTCKFLMLEWQKLPESVPEIDESEMVDLDFKYSYDTVLKQLEDGDLDVNDVVKKPEPEEEDTVPRQMQDQHIPVASEGKSTPAQNADQLVDMFNVPQDWVQKAQTSCAKPEDAESKVEEERYRQLQDLVLPQINDPEYYNKLQGDQFTNDKEYKILKEIYMKSFNYQKLQKLHEDTGMKPSIWEYVDLQGSIDDGIFKVKETLSEADKKKILSMENFDNFSTELKILVLTDYLKAEKALMSKKSELQLLEKDVFGRTAMKRYKLVKSLVKDLQYNLFVKGFAAAKNEATN